MKRYKLLQPVILGFATPGNQFDYLYTPGDNVLLEADGQSIWLVTSTGKRKESDTIPGAIDIWLKEGRIAEEK